MVQVHKRDDVPDRESVRRREAQSGLDHNAHSRQFWAASTRQSWQPANAHQRLRRAASSRTVMGRAARRAGPRQTTGAAVYARVAEPREYALH